jgi:hypothetical protein
MSHKIGRLSLWLVAILLAGCLPLSLSAQYGDTQASPAKPAHKMMVAAQSATGCLQKGEEPGGFSLTGEDGKFWELSSTSVILSHHLGHTVTVTGSVTHKSKTQEVKMEEHEKKEAGGKEYADLHVTSLKMVSDACK